MPGSPALPPPLHRTHRLPPFPATATPEPPFEIQELGRGPQTGSEKRLRREQRDVLAGSAIDLHEVTRPEILDPRCVEGEHSGSPKFRECSQKPEANRLSTADAQSDRKARR